MEAACELLTVELRLDRIEAELADELPRHVRRFAQAHARGERPPPAPDAVLRPATLATARAALVHPVLADRGLALLRLAAPAAIEADAAVAAARAAEPSWPALSVLAAARDAAAHARFARGAVEVLHRLHGSAVGDTGAPLTSGPGDEAGVPPRIAGWFEPDGVVGDDRAIAETWEGLRTRHGVDGALRFERAPGARPRAFVVEPGREVIAVIPERIATPAQRFAVLHELGHAIAALALAAGIPRVLDEAAAAYIARAIERPGERWYSAHGVAARARRRTLATALDRIERALPELPAPPPISEQPPWALWHDPGAQAAYVAAERIADEIDRELGLTPVPGALAAALAAHREPIDRLGSGTYAV